MKNKIFGLIFIVVVPLALVVSSLEAGARDYSRHPRYELFGDPTAFFFIHAYTDLTHWDYQKDHRLPLQFHSAQGDSGQFSNQFTALFVGSEISPTLAVLAQLHFHLNPIPGQVAPTVVVPQSKLMWRPLENNNLKIHFGRFYSPFGITNDDVQSPLNRFVSQPYSGYTAIPFHWFDTGIQLDLAGGMGEKMGANLSVAFTNGPQRIVPDIPPSFNALDKRILMPPSAPGGALLKTSYTDGGHGVTARLGLFPGLPNLEVGGSYTTGVLRKSWLLEDDPVGPGIPAGDRNLTGQFPAEWSAVGVDLQYQIGPVSFRADWNRSEEELTGPNSRGFLAPDDTIERDSWRAELGIHILKDMQGTFKDVWLTFRADERDPDAEMDDNSDLRRYTFGLNFSPHKQVMFKANYEIVEEVNSAQSPLANKGGDLDNNGVLFQAVVNF